MAGGCRDSDSSKRGAGEGLAEGRRRVGGGGTGGPALGAPLLLALQRSAGNATVGALMAGRFRSRGGEGLGAIDTALGEIRRDEPDVAKVEPGLKAAKAAGVPVDLDGAGQKPPPSALNVVTSGFGPASVPAMKPVPAPKPTAAKSPLAKAAKPAKKLGGPPAGVGAAKAPAPAVASGAAAPAGASPILAAGEVDVLAPPTAPSLTAPEADPGFRQVTGAVKGYATVKKAHPPAAAKAKEAQDAAVAPSGDVDSQAKAAKVDTMDAQPAGSFDKKAFIAAVKAAIEAKSPKNLKEAAAYKESGKAGEVKGEVKALVAGGERASAEKIETAAETPPDPTKAVPKPVTPMPAEQPGQPAAIPAAAAAPKPAPSDQLNLAAGTHEANQTMAEADVTDQQLAESNEPQFEGAVTAKREAAQHANTAPAEYRQEEKAELGQARAEADQQTAAATAGIHGSKAAALAKVVGGKAATKGTDEAKRAEVTTKVQNIFAATEADVKKILDGLDPKVDKEFETGEKGARAAFETYVATKMAAYKKDRYGGWLGGLRWAKDKLLGMPSKVNEFFDAGRELYLKEMDKVISRVADVVAADLTAAKTRIAKGRTEIAAYVKSLPTELQKVGAQASKDIGEQFAQLESDVDAKQEALVDTLATKYTESRKGLDERIEALQAENKGLVDKAIGAIKAVINTIRELAAMLRNVFARAAGVVGSIIKAPAKFLGNLVAGVKGGILKFKDNILTHLKKGLMGWLMGSLAQGGIELPESFDLKGILKLLLQLFGLTWANIRARLVRSLGAPVVAFLEKSVDIFAKLAKEGPAALWSMLVEKVGDIKDMIIEKAKDFVVTKIVTAGIMWLVSLLNPAAAFIKACKLIYDIVMFFIDNGSRIMAFVNTVIDSVADIARGAIGGVIDKIEDVLGKMVPLLIGFLASLLGVGGIGKKIREIVETLQKPVTKALDAVIGAGLKIAAPLIRGMKKVGAKVKSKVEAGKAYVKGKVEAGKEWATGVKDKITGRGGVPSAAGGKQAGETAALAEADLMLAARPDHATAMSKVAAIGRRYSTPLRLVIDQRAADSEHVHVQTSRTATHVLPAAPADEPEMPEGLSRKKKEKWKECQELYRRYKEGTGKEVSALAAEINELKGRYDKLTRDEKRELCAKVHEQLKLVEGLINDRRRYIDSGCDEFDWFKRGKTEAERRRAHEGEVRNVKAQEGNLRGLLHKLQAEGVC